LVPLLNEGIQSIFNESYKMCFENNELSKYLMTFQNLLSRIPKWNETIIENEKNRIVEKSNCNYLEDLITCVHVVQLKILTYMRVGNTQKQIDISIPKIDTFIHKVYIHIARRLYVNTYLFECSVSKLQTQKNNREIDRIPTEDIIRQYTDESIEHDEEVTIEHIAPAPVPVPVPVPVPNPVPNPVSVSVPMLAPAFGSASVLTATTQIPSIYPHAQASVTNESSKSSLLTFNDYDNVLDSLNNTNVVCVPKHSSLIENPLETKLSDISTVDNNMYQISDTSLDLSDVVMVKGPSSNPPASAPTMHTSNKSSMDDDCLLLDDVEVIK
jgi:hypothetical protein